MSTEDFIIALFMRVDSVIGDLDKHPDAHLHPSELVTLGLLFALKGTGSRAFYRWLSNNYRHWFPKLPERTRLFRLLPPILRGPSTSWPTRPPWGWSIPMGLS